MKKMFNRINEAGTMLVEAMAMLGLIAMVTPILYKKAAERTTELQDINASNQLRILAEAMDSYIKDNFTRINDGETVVNSCHVGSVDYAGFTDATSVSFDVSHLCEYLPYGFLKDGQTQDSKLFTNADPSYKVVLRKTTGTENDESRNPVVVAETITGFLTAVPNEGDEFPSNRVARIATMVGSNGGYVQDDGKIMGAQGIWSLDNDGELGLNLPAKTFVISSLQPISSQGLANEDVLHRKTERQNDYVLNSMETDLFMSYNDKNHNIRQVNQIIMSPQKDWMLGGDLNDFNRAVDDTPSMEYGQVYEPSLDYTLYIGEKGGAYMEGNLAALASLFTVRSEEETDGGIKYYGTSTSPDTTDPANPTTVTSKSDNYVFGVTTSKMEYGNIGEDTAGVLLTVDNGNGNMVFESKTTSTSSTGEDKTSSQKLVDANASRVNVLDGALSIRNPGVAADGGKYDMYHTQQWPEQNAAPAVIVGGGAVHKASYTTYEYTEDGVPVINADGTIQATDKTEGEHALTVNGPAFVKDSLKTAKLKAYDVDAAKLRGGARYEDFNTATLDSDFYLVAEQKGTETDPNGRLLVGHYLDNAGGENRYRLQIAEEDDTLNDGTIVQSGIKMSHKDGVNVVAGDPNERYDIGLVEYNPDDKSSVLNSDPSDGQIKLGAFNGISLATMDTNGQFIDKSAVSIQDDMLRAYNQMNGTDLTSRSIGYLDSVTDQARFIARTATITHDDLYSRYGVDNEGLFALGGMDLTVSENKTNDDGAQPVLDVKATRQNMYTSTRLSGGFAVFDYDVDPASKTNVDGVEVSDYPLDGRTKGNPALYMDKGDFQILATAKNETASIEKGDIILQVDNNSDVGVIADNDDRGSVYIRKGAINIGGKDFGNAEYARLTNTDVVSDYEEINGSDGSAQGYIAADRFISHTRPTENALSASSEGLSGNVITGINSAGTKPLVSYNKYEINPAYTSVMHDIKLTTRGGARLSDILPDLVNKGIYVVDNTFKEDTNWVGSTPGSQVEWGDNPPAESYTSAYLGFVPSPTCPQGYSKVVTINPSGWAMAQAGTPVNNGGSLDIATHNNPFLYWYTQDQQLRTAVEEVEPVNPLTFQKSTWLRAMVMPYCDGAFQMDGECSNSSEEKAFSGWGAVLGFVYPEAYYREFLDWDNAGLGMGGHANQGSKDQGTDTNTVYWNLFPVQYRQLEAYVTVYCYFNRKAFLDSSMVDTTYDQLKGTTRRYWEKGNTDYSRRLNDPTLKYTDPW